MKKFISVLKVMGFYFLSFTWGIILTGTGVLVSAAMLITGHKPHLFKCDIYFEAGEKWKGINLGVFFIIHKNSELSEKQRLAGYGIENAVFGVVTPFIVTIPFLLRNWLRRFKTYETKRLFSILLFLISEFVVIVTCTIGFFWNVHLMHVCCCIIVYIIPLFVWLLAYELPQYQTGDEYKQPFFDTMADWFGQKFYK